MLSSNGKCSKYQLLNAAQKLKRKYRPCREDVHLGVEFSPLVLCQVQVSLLTEFGALLKTLWSDVTGASTWRVKEVGKVWGVVLKQGQKHCHGQVWTGVDRRHSGIKTFCFYNNRDKNTAMDRCEQEAQWNKKKIFYNRDKNTAMDRCGQVWTRGTVKLKHFVFTITGTKTLPWTGVNRRHSGIKTFYSPFAAHLGTVDFLCWL